MTAIVTTLRATVADRRAGTATEYALMAGILAVSLAPAFAGLLGKLNITFNGLNF